jgi:hypothetical protein
LVGTIPGFSENSFESDEWLPVAFQKSSVKIRERYQPMERAEKQCAIFKRVKQIQKILMLSSWELINSM